MKKPNIDLHDAQIGVLEGFTNAFRLAKEAEKDGVLKEAVAELGKMDLGAMTNLSLNDRAEVSTSGSRLGAGLHRA